MLLQHGVLHLHVARIYTVPCTENPIYVFLEMKLRGLVPSSYIHVSVSDLYILRIGLPTLAAAK